MPRRRTPFRVAVVGAGIAGLSMALALERAGIDYVLLEKRDRITSTEPGAGLFLFPPAVRLVHQLGCLDALEKCGTRIVARAVRYPDGSVLRENGKLKDMPAMFGYASMLVDRQDFLNILFQSLRDKSRIVTGKAVRQIEHTESGVRLILDDGSVECADIVLGADGVNSTVRSILWQHANSITPGSIPSAEISCLATSYYILYGASSQIPGIGAGRCEFVQNHGYSILTFSAEEKVYWGIIIKSEETTHWPQRIRRTSEDVEKEIARYLDRPVNETVRFRQVWDARITYGATGLEEGVFEHWHSGRIALMGDAVHKMTPDSGFGANCAMQDVAFLANLLKKELDASMGGSLSNENVFEIFQTYQEGRKNIAKGLVKYSGGATRRASDDGWVAKMMGLYVVPLLEGSSFGRKRFSEMMKSGIKLNYVNEPALRVGKQRWHDTPGIEEERMQVLTARRHLPSSWLYAGLSIPVLLGVYFSKY